MMVLQIFQFDIYSYCVFASSPRNWIKKSVCLFILLFNPGVASLNIINDAILNDAKY